MFHKSYELLELMLFVDVQMIHVEIGSDDDRHKLCKNSTRAFENIRIFHPKLNPCLDPATSHPFKVDSMPMFQS